MFLSFLPLMLMHASYFILRVQGSGGALRPHDAFTRAEFAQVLMNFAGWAG